jgi:hypothetical protein
MKTVHILGHVLFGLVVAAGFIAAVMLLWNWLMPEIFGWMVINFWQALGLLALARILFGGLGYKHWLKKHHRHSNFIHEKWMKMTDEERKEFMKKRHFARAFFHECKSEKQE